MGILQNGDWLTQNEIAETKQGKFIRPESPLRHWVTIDGRQGPTGTQGFKAEAGRYHLYVSLACPWAHRTLIFRHLKGLSKIISVSIVHPYMGENGWSFDTTEGATGDTLFQSDYLHQLYTRAIPDYSGRVTVPVLWDKKQQTIVSNESADIIRMFNESFAQVGACGDDYYPQDIRKEIDLLNDRIYHTVNNGVYKAGFASNQEAYEQAVFPLFDSLDFLEDRLSQARYLCGSRVTEADWRLFTTLIRFDAVYYGHFKCNLRQISDYPHLMNYLRELYQWDGIADTVNFDHIKTHYYRSHPQINPSLIIPAGPILTLDLPHDRNKI